MLKILLLKIKTKNKKLKLCYFTQLFPLKQNFNQITIFSILMFTANLILRFCDL